MNRKILLAGIFILIIAAFTACGNNSGASGNGTASIPSSESSSASTAESSADKEDSSSSDSVASQSSQEIAPESLDSESSSSEETANGDTGSEPSILIAYFSWSGNTKQLAELIQEQIGGELFEIVPETPYTDDINQLSGISLQEQRDNVRPPLSSVVEDMSNYDVVFIGYPSWWSDMPMPVFTFLESYDFSGKTVVPFTTYGNSVWGRSIQSIKEILPGAAISEGFAVQEHEMQGVSQKVEEWLQGLKL